MTISISGVWAVLSGLALDNVAALVAVFALFVFRLLIDSVTPS